MTLNLKKILLKIQALLAAVVIIALITVAFPLVGITVITLIFSNVSFLYNLVMEVAKLVM